MQQATLLFVLSVCSATALLGQGSTSDRNGPNGAPVASLADSLQRTGNTQLHIFYVHGIGANGPGDSDSELLRASICKYLKDCTTKEGQLEGTEYADSDKFALNAPPPSLTYLGEAIWKSGPSGGPSEEWNASAPYVDHWKLARTDAPAIYIDEINWWPLMFALKCRQIVAQDAALVGPNVPYIDLCSKSDPDPDHPGRFRLYPWISSSDAQRLKALPARGALINRKLKNNLFDWGFSDALLAVGPMRPLLLEGIRELVLKSVNVNANGSRQGTVGPRPNQEFVIVSHSLGSYLMFSALDMSSPELDTPTMKEWQKEFENILSHTSIVYYFANQLRLLELANLDVNGNLIDHLNTWSQLRHKYLDSQTASGRKDLAPPEIVAWSDPSDLLTWSVPEFSTASGQQIVVVKNRSVKNGIHWFFLFEGPTTAHDNYASNKKVISAMLKRTKSPPA